MASRWRRERDWRGIEDEERFRNRPGALDRRWGYGEPSSKAYRRRGRRSRQRLEDEYPDQYNAPDYWISQRKWMQQGPYEGVGPRNYRRSDERIRDDICLRLTQHGQIDASEVEVDVEEGQVTLTGTVEDRRIKRMVEANVELISGVIDVHNRLRLRNKPSQEQLQKERRAREMADRFPGGPEPSGPAAMLDEEQSSDR
jgi:hypothetical protein